VQAVGVLRALRYFAGVARAIRRPCLAPVVEVCITACPAWLGFLLLRLSFISVGDLRPSCFSTPFLECGSLPASAYSLVQIMS